MTIHCLAIDDDPTYLDLLVSHINKIPYLQLSGACRTADEARQHLRDEVIDAIFMAIDIPDVNGIDFVKSLDSTPIVVFVTSHPEYAIAGYKVNAADFLLKPYTFEDVKAAAEKVKRRHFIFNHLPTLILRNFDDFIFFKTEHRVVRVDIADIIYIESQSEYLKIHLRDQKPLMVLLSMKRIEERLPPSFMRIHRSYIVNLKRIAEVNKSRVRTITDNTLPIGDSYRERFISYLRAKYLGK